MSNLLQDHVFSVRLTSGVTVAASLPELLAHLVADTVESLSALRPHQKQPLHCFLAQVGALALLAGGETEPPLDAARWQSLLRGLTPDFPNDEPWTLVVDKLLKPAFLQPPVPEDKWEALKETEPTPDALDMLVTSKNHEVKAARVISSSLEYWIYALLTTQTMEGYPGSGNYGISRMNSGSGSRPFVGAWSGMGNWGAHICRDMRALVSLHSKIIERYPFYMPVDGLKLVWLSPWDGQEQIRLNQLDPLYIEICRRIRMRQVGSGYIAHRATTGATRIDSPKTLKGDIGDPWTPFDLENTQSLTLGEGGFSYKKIITILNSGRHRPALLQVVSDNEQQADGQILFVVVVRGKSKTRGFHERTVTIPPRAVPRFRRAQLDGSLATLGRDRIVNVAALSSKALRPALFTLLQGAPDKLDFKDPKAKGKADVLLARFEQRVDADFFERLFDELTDEPHSIAATAKRRAWIVELEAHARDILAIAESGSPLSFVRRYRARAAAESVLAGSIRNHFKDIFGDAP